MSGCACSTMPRAVPRFWAGAAAERRKASSGEENGRGTRRVPWSRDPVTCRRRKRCRNAVETLSNGLGARTTARTPARITNCTTVPALRAPAVCYTSPTPRTSHPARRVPRLGPTTRSRPASPRLRSTIESEGGRQPKRNIRIQIVDLADHLLAQVTRRPVPNHARERKPGPAEDRSWSSRGPTCREPMRLAAQTTRGDRKTLGPRAEPQVMLVPRPLVAATKAAVLSAHQSRPRDRSKARARQTSALGVSESARQTPAHADRLRRGGPLRKPPDLRDVTAVGPRNHLEGISYSLRAHVPMKTAGRERDSARWASRFF
jgi:hypothetical protein